MSIDDYRPEVEAALQAGATKADIARTLGVPYSSLYQAIERWHRPTRAKPGADALDALRRLVESS